VLALAVIGTAGAFGYRSYFGGAVSSAPPPVIRASGEPSKVAPPPAKADPAASKFSYDRFGDRGKDEQVVVREEKPVDSTALARSSVPRTVLPGAPVASSPPNGAAATSMNTAPSALGEPKRVRTVHIRPDQPDIPAIPQSVAAAPPMPLAPPQTNAAGGLATSSEVLTAPPSTRAAASHAQTSRPPARVASRVAPPAPAANAPLSLNPNSNVAPPPIQDSAPVRAATPPARLASAPATGGSGGYLVQVSSQRSEADAQASYRNIQARYSSVLGGHPHLVRRADLGSRGVYYRAMVGPFGSRDQAIALCSSLKAAGGDCVVQAN
jgi:hypothetical protein